MIFNFTAPLSHLRSGS